MGEKIEVVEDDIEGGRIPSSDAGPIPGGMDEATRLAIFGDYRQFGSYMMSLSSRLKIISNQLLTRQQDWSHSPGQVERIAEHQHRGYVGRLFGG